MTGLCPSVQVADADFNGETARFIAVVPDANNHYPRAAQGEVGLLEGWTLAKVVNETIDADADNAVKRPIIAVIDVPSRLWPSRRSVRYSSGAGGRRGRLRQGAACRTSGDWPDRRQSDVRGVSPTATVPIV